VSVSSHFFHLVHCSSQQRSCGSSPIKPESQRFWSRLVTRRLSSFLQLMTRHLKDTAYISMDDESASMRFESISKRERGMIDKRTSWSHYDRSYPPCCLCTIHQGPRRKKRHIRIQMPMTPTAGSEFENVIFTSSSSSSSDDDTFSEDDMGLMSFSDSMNIFPNYNAIAADRTQYAFPPGISLSSHIFKSN